MDELINLIEASQKKEQKKDVLDALEYLAKKNINEYLSVFKDIFFHPLTDHEIRLDTGKIMARAKDPIVYNFLITQLILRNFADLSAIVYALGEYRSLEVFHLLVREYPTSSFEVKLEIIEALSKIQSVESIEFFSKVFNEEIKESKLNNIQIQEIKQKASNALQKMVIDI